MLTLDGPAHDRQSQAMRPPFAAATAGPTVRDDLPKRFDALIDGFVADGRAELVADYAEPLANLSLAAALGLRHVGWEDLAGWCRGLCTAVSNFENDPAKAAVGARRRPSWPLRWTSSSTPRPAGWPPSWRQASIGTRSSTTSA